LDSMNDFLAGTCLFQGKYYAKAEELYYQYCLKLGMEFLGGRQRDSEYEELPECVSFVSAP
jgi:hypothetical protein